MNTLENPQLKLKLKSKIIKPALQKDIQFIGKNQLNNSSSKMQYSFPQSERFHKSINPIPSSKFYDLPQVLQTQRRSSFGYGTKIQFGKNGKKVPGPGDYQIQRQFEGFSSKGSTMGLSREDIKFNDMFGGSLKVSFPQPASYHISPSQRSPKISIGERFVEKRKWIDFVPGPGNYNHQQPTSKLTSTVSNFRKSPAAKFTKTERLKQLLQTSLLTPGPGNYNTNKTTIKKEGTSFGKAQRVEKISINKHISPSPASYNSFSEFLY